jgi:hypothetical protein
MRECRRSPRRYVLIPRKHSEEGYHEKKRILLYYDGVVVDRIYRHSTKIVTILRIMAEVNYFLLVD